MLPVSCVKYLLILYMFVSTIFGRDVNGHIKRKKNPNTNTDMDIAFKYSRIDIRNGFQIVKIMALNQN